MAEAPQIVVGRPGHGEGRRAEVGRGSVPAKRSLGFEILSWLATLAVAVVASLLTAVGLALYFGPVVVLLFAAGVIVLLSVVALLEERFMGVVLAVIGIVAALYATPYALVLTAAGLAFAVARPVPKRQHALRLVVLVGLPVLSGLLVLLTGFRLGK